MRLHQNAGFRHSWLDLSAVARLGEPTSKARLGHPLCQQQPAQNAKQSSPSDLQCGSVRNIRQFHVERAIWPPTVPKSIAQNAKQSSLSDPFRPAMPKCSKHSSISNLQCTKGAILPQKVISILGLPLDTFIQNGPCWPNRLRILQL